MTKDFTIFGLPPKLLQALARMQFTTPTPIQELTIPFALEGRDILGSAQTGTGKTGAFGIPLIAKLMEHAESAALIMTPTRELATQVMAAVQQLIPVQNIPTALLIGGEAMPKQFRQLQRHPRLIVGTPGRINDHLARGSLKLNNVRYLVLDETDRMLDMGFGVQIDKIVGFLPKERQTMLFSATLPAGIIKLSNKYLTNPQRVSAGSTTAVAPNIQQELIHTSDAEKHGKLLEQLANHKGAAIIFVKTKYGTEKLADKLTRLDYKADALHGDLKQSRRDRVVQSFRDKKFHILVATDVAARGLDVPHIELVINYDMPQCPEDYIHRIGRTARAGASGKAINLLTPADRAKWNAIHRLMNPNASRAEYAPQPRSSERRGGGGEHRGNHRNGEQRSERRSDEHRGERRSSEHRNGEYRGGEQRSSEHRSGEHRSVGENRGGEYRGGENRGGENRGGEQRSGENRGGEYRGKSSPGGNKANFHKRKRFGKQPSAAHTGPRHAA